MTEAFESFIYRYGPADGRYTVVEVGETVDHWPMFVVRFGDKTAVLQLCGVGADSDNGDHHLSLDIHAFVDDQLARPACSAWRTAGGTKRSATPHPVPPTVGRRSRASASWSARRPHATSTDNQHVPRPTPSRPNPTRPPERSVTGSRRIRREGRNRAVREQPHRAADADLVRGRRRLPRTTPAQTGPPSDIRPAGSG
jgi:hypothetical protein